MYKSGFFLSAGSVFLYSFQTIWKMFLLPSSLSAGEQWQEIWLRRIRRVCSFSSSSSSAASISTLPSCSEMSCHFLLAQLTSPGSLNCWEQKMLTVHLLSLFIHLIVSFSFLLSLCKSQCFSVQLLKTELLSKTFHFLKLLHVKLCFLQKQKVHQFLSWYLSV